MELIERSAARAVTQLGAGRLTVGRDPANDLHIDHPSVSRLHAAIEAVGSGFVVYDLGSRNGTVVNGTRVFGYSVLRHGDAVTFGGAGFEVRDTSGRSNPTVPLDPPPEITRRERDVLVELCRPLIKGALFTEPSSTTEIARRLYISESAVRMHLSRLYGKFGLPDANQRRAQLALAAIERGAVHPADLTWTPATP